MPVAGSSSAGAGNKLPDGWAVETGSGFGVAVAAPLFAVAAGGRVAVFPVEADGASVGEGLGVMVLATVGVVIWRAVSVVGVEAGGVAVGLTGMAAAVALSALTKERGVGVFVGSVGVGVSAPQQPLNVVAKNKIAITIRG